ncbi:hypothetical protein TYRP_007144 [Tyrophagus putrescentiae]|nr:hypothetical protein TYRP_007144 [Tyrophagus putrescentiae]
MRVTGVKERKNDRTKTTSRDECQMAIGEEDVSGGVIIESDHHQSPAFTEGGFCSPSERRHQNTSAKYFQQYLCAVVHLQTYMIV